MEFAELKGTEKQVKWAKAIRKDRLRVWQEFDADRFQHIEPMLSQQNIASWWIANKDKTLEEISGRSLVGTKPVASKKTADGATCMPKISSRRITAREECEGMIRVWTATGFTQIGPTRHMVTGEIVSDDTLPF